MDKRDQTATGAGVFVAIPWQRWRCYLRQGIHWVLQFLVGIVALGAVVLMVLGFVSSHASLPLANPKLAVESILHIPAGSSSAEIGRLLEEQSIVRSGIMFSRVSQLLGTDQRLQAGDYLLSPGMNLMEIIGNLESGRVATKRVLIHEGMNAEQIAQRLADYGLVDKERFLALVADERLIYGDSFPVPKPYPALEGYLFPDTYIFAVGQSEEEIIKKMVARFVEVALPELETKAEAIGYTVHEIVTLASIIEKEAMVERELPIISGVFHNRLNVGMRLQSDPTVQYVMENPRPRLYLRDLEIDSPFNTYKYAGLPPGPISSPGKAALLAAAEPADVDYMYFVAKGDGTHVFSRTYAEHLRNRRRVGW